MAALMQRATTGQGQEVQSALYENNIFLVPQHMMQFAMTGRPAAPMPQKISPWDIYDVFTVSQGEQIFLAVVGDTQWKVFCDAFGYADWFADTRLHPVCAGKSGDRKEILTGVNGQIRLHGAMTRKRD